MTIAQGRKVDIRQLKYFIAVAESGGFSAASARLYVAQPAISAQIQQLESELGCSLFVRHARGTKLTLSGQSLMAHAHAIMRQIEAARLDVQNASDDAVGYVKLGLPTSIANVLATPLIDLVRRRSPRVTLQITEGLSGEIEQGHAEHRFDLAILMRSELRGLQGSLHLVEEDVCLFGPKAPQAGGSGDIRFAALADLPLYHSSRLHACRKLIEQTAQRMNIKLNVIAEVDSIHRLNDLAVRGDGYTVFPRTSITEKHMRQGHCYRIVDPAIRLSSVLVSNTAEPPSRATQVVLDVLPGIVGDLLKTRRWSGGHLPTEAPPLAHA